MIVQAAPPAHFDWLIARTGCAITKDFRAIEAVDSGGRVRGMVGFDLWTVNSVQAHVALDTPVAWRALLRPTFAYPFLEAKRGVLVAVIPAHNARSVALTRHLGFQEAHRIRDGWAAGDDLIVFEMRRESCQWLSGLTRKAA